MTTKSTVRRSTPKARTFLAKTSALLPVSKRIRFPLYSTSAAKPQSRVRPEPTKQRGPVGTVAVTQYAKLGHDFSRELDIGQTAGGNEATVAYGRRVHVHRGPSVVRHVLLQVVKAVIRVPASTKKPCSCDNGRRRTNGGDWHRTRLEGLEGFDQRALNRLLFPPITAWQDEHRYVGRVELGESSSRLNGETTHRLNRFAGETHDLDVILAVPTELRKRMCRFPVGEARYR